MNTGDTGTEVDRLGHSINVLSERLEETISELKGANILVPLTVLEDGTKLAFIVEENIPIELLQPAV